MWTAEPSCSIGQGTKRMTERMRSQKEVNKVKKATPFYRLTRNHRVLFLNLYISAVTKAEKKPQAIAMLYCRSSKVNQSNPIEFP